MKILLIHDYGTQSGGAENYTFNLMESLRQKRVEIRLFSSNVSHRGFPVLADYVFRAAGPETGRIKKFINNIYSREARKKLKSALKEFNPDIVHLQMFLHQCSPAILAELDGKLVFATIHEYSLFCPNNMKFILGKNSQCFYNPGICCVRERCVSYYGLLQFFAKRIIMNKYKAVVKFWLPPSSYSESLFSSLGITNVKRIPYGFDLDKYKYMPLSSRPAQKQVLFLGRLDKSKGGEVLLRAFGIIIKTMPDAKLLIVGSGSQSVNLRKEVESSGLSANVRFVDWVEHGSIRDLHYNSTLLVAPSLWPDNLPLVICESMLYGTPVLASRIGGIPDLLGEWRECLFKPGQADELAEKIICLLKDLQLANCLSEKSRIKAEEMLDMKIHIERLLNIYKSK